jgi:hypothetical protein
MTQATTPTRSITGYDVFVILADQNGPARAANQCRVVGADAAKVVEWIAR